jgi:hypothetical protein
VNLNRRLVQVMLLASILLGGIFMLWYWYGDRRDRYNWSETYSISAEEPFDLSDFHRLAQNHFARTKLLDRATAFQTEFADTNAGPRTYLFIGNNQYLRRDDIDSLLRAVRAGADAFIATDGYSDYLIEQLGIGFRRIMRMDSTESYFLQHPDFKGKEYKLSYFYRDTLNQYFWASWETANQAYYLNQNNDVVLLGVNALGNAHFIRAGLGRGRVFLHSAPGVFTNLMLSRDSGLVYSLDVLRHLNPSSTLLWDEISRKPKPEYEPGGGENRSPLSFILSEPALRTAWYILLGTLLILLLFRSRRTQRIIPVLPVNRNGTMEFTRAIGREFHRTRNYSGLQREQWQVFLAYVRQHFGLSTQALDTNFTQRLASRSGQPLEQINALIQTGEQFAQRRINAMEAAHFHRMLARFYQQHRKNQ